MTTTFQLFSDHLSSSQFLQLFSTALKVVPSLPPSAQLFSPLPCSSQLSLTTLTSAHLVFTLLNSSQLASTLLQLFPPLLTSASAQLISPLSQPISTFLTYSTLASSSQLFSPPVTRMLTQRASCYTEKHLHTASSCARQALTRSKLLRKGSFCTEKLLHKASFCTEKLLHKEAFTQRSCYTQQAFAQRSSYTEKLLHTATFCTEKILQKAGMCTQNLLQETLLTIFDAQQALHTVRPQSMSQYYFVLRSLHKTRPSTTSTTKLAQSTS